MKEISKQLIIRKQLKEIVRWMESVLPRTMFNTLYRVAFPIYRCLVRYLYLCKGFLYFVTGNKEKWTMVKSIFRIMPFSLVGTGGVEATYRIVNEVCRKNIPGDIIELGVARGGCAALMAMVMFNRTYFGKPPRNLWLFDSYEGLPEPTAKDFNIKLGQGTGEHVRPLPKGSCLATLEEVQRLMFVKNDFPRNNIQFVKGWFEKTLPVVKKEIQETAVLRIDADWYESTKCCLENLYDKVTSGGYVIVDDYQSCYGCRRAVDEFIRKRRLVPDIKFDGRGGCYFKKASMSKNSLERKE